MLGYPDFIACRFISMRKAKKALSLTERSDTFAAALWNPEKVTAEMFADLFPKDEPAKAVLTLSDRELGHDLAISTQLQAGVPAMGAAPCLIVHSDLAVKVASEAAAGAGVLRLIAIPGDNRQETSFAREHSASGYDLVLGANLLCFCHATIPASCGGLESIDQLVAFFLTHLAGNLHDEQSLAVVTANDKRLTAPTTKKMEIAGKVYEVACATFGNEPADLSYHQTGKAKVKEAAAKFNYLGTGFCARILEPEGVDTNVYSRALAVTIFATRVGPGDTPPLLLAPGDDGDEAKPDAEIAKVATKQ